MFLNNICEILDAIQAHIGTARSKSSSGKLQTRAHCICVSRRKSTSRFDLYKHLVHVDRMRCLQIAEFILFADSETDVDRALVRCGPSFKPNVDRVAPDWLDPIFVAWARSAQPQDASWPAPQASAVHTQAPRSLRGVCVRPTIHAWVSW